jgi:hypothetical protein
MMAMARPSLTWVGGRLTLPPKSEVVIQQTNEPWGGL